MLHLEKWDPSRELTKPARASCSGHRLINSIGSGPGPSLRAWGSPLIIASYDRRYNASESGLSVWQKD